MSILYEFGSIFLDFGKILETKMTPQIDVWSAFLALFFVASFLMFFLIGFDVFFTLETLKISIFPKGKYTFLRSGAFGTCFKNAFKTHPKKLGI